MRSILLSTTTCLLLTLHAASVLGEAPQEAARLQLRTWTDTSGYFSMEASLLARDEANVVLESKDRKRLVSVAIDQLSQGDQEYLTSNEEMHHAGAHEFSTWHLKNGLKINAALAEYGRKKVTLQRRRGKVYANDKRLESLPEFYQAMVPRVVSHFEDKPLTDHKAFHDWMNSQRGKPVEYSVDGVVMEFESGDLYAIPFFAFTAADRAMLEPGWKEWLVAHESDDHDMKMSSALNLRAESMAYQRSREQQIQEQQLRVSQLQLQTHAYNAGLFDLWSVNIVPVNGYGRWYHVVVPGRNSDQATQAALAKYPGYRVNSIAKVNRRR